jgi:hypothetical protein
LGYKVAQFLAKNCLNFYLNFKINILLMKNDFLNKTNLSLTHQMVNFVKIMPKICWLNPQAAVRVNQKWIKIFVVVAFLTGKKSLRPAPARMKKPDLNLSNIDELVLLLHVLQPGSALPDRAILKKQIDPNLEVVFQLFHFDEFFRSRNFLSLSRMIPQNTVGFESLIVSGSVW